MLDLIDIINPMDLTDIYRTHHLSLKECTSPQKIMFLSPKIDHILAIKKFSTDARKLKQHFTFCLTTMIKDEYQRKDRNKRKLKNSWKPDKSLQNEKLVKKQIKDF